MRFLTFVKNNVDFQVDKELKLFASWVFRSKIGQRNPQAGVPQIALFMDFYELPLAVKRGFTKWCVAYFNEPENMLPNHLKKDIQTLINFTTRY